MQQAIVGFDLIQKCLKRALDALFIDGPHIVKLNFALLQSGFFCLVNRSQP